jgi:hypothetical protein
MTVARVVRIERTRAEGRYRHLVIMLRHKGHGIEYHLPAIAPSRYRHRSGAAGFSVERADRQFASPSSGNFALDFNCCFNVVLRLLYPTKCDS